MARKILLADDSVTAQNMGRKILTDAGYEVVTVNNGSAALKKVAEHKPDLIVLDVYMPGYSGLEVCQRLKENRETARIPILLTVGKLEPFKPEEARRVKADAYVVKPFEASELLTALTRLEDKIVPQASDNQKPGRFAKAIAAFEGGEKFGDAESGWKDRLRFPTSEKKQESEPDPEIPAPSSHAFRDLSREEAQKGTTAHPEFERPLPAGLPADITPEEIAAITAAAAQLSGKPIPSPAVKAEPAAQPQEGAQASASAVVEEKAAGESVAAEVVAGESATPAEAVAAGTEPSPSEVAQASTSNATSQEEATPVTLASVAATSEVAESSVAEQLAVAQETKAEAATVPDSIAASPERAGEAAVTDEPGIQAEPPKFEEKLAEPVVTADSDVIAALDTLTPSNGNGQAHVSDSVPAAPTDGIAPPAMVAAAAAIEMAQAGVARWIAEPVAVEHTEATASLEGEMQKAFAAFAAADAARTSLPSPVAISGSYVVPFVAPNNSAVEPATEAPADLASIASPAPSPETTPAPATSAVEAVASAPVVPVEAEAPPSPENSSNEDVGAQPTTSDDIDRKDAHADALRAAAWANWHQIRESIVGSTSIAAAENVQDNDRDATTSPEPTTDSDAMAAAASAGTSSSTAAEAGAIANIVDSVLAELRPKIVAEITKKLDTEKKNKK